MATAKSDDEKIVADNRKARHNYEIGEVFEAGIQLAGTEVKSLRAGKATIGDAFAQARGGELFLLNAYIPEYLEANRFNHDPKRPRKLLLKRREIAKLAHAVDRDGMTVVPLRVYFTPRGYAKVALAIARGRKDHDKRDAIKQRDWNRDKARVLRDRG